MFRRTNTLVCVDCNELVLQPTNDKVLLRCPLGHRVQGIKPRAAWLEIALSLFVAWCASSFFIGVGNALTANASAAAALVCVLFSAWAAFLFSRGLKFRRSKDPTKQLATQYLGSGAGFLLVAIVIACGLAAGVFRW